MSKKAVVVTRHPALVELLVEWEMIPAGTRVIEHATVADVRGRDVIGVLPLHLAAEANTVTEVPLALSQRDRGSELGLPRLREIAGEPVTYIIERVGRRRR